MGLALAPPHWFGAYMLPLGYVLTNTVILQSSKSDSIQYYIDAINKYMVRTPSFITQDHSKTCNTVI